MQELIDSWNAVAEDVENDVSYKDKDIKGEDDLETVEPRGLLDKRLEKKHCSIQYLSQDQVFKVMYEYFIKYFGFQLTPTYFDYVIEYNAAKGGSQEHSSMKRHEERRTKREEKEAERLQDPKAVSPSLAGQIACQLCIEDDSISVAQKHSLLPSPQSSARLRMEYTPDQQYLSETMILLNLETDDSI
ncbi:hypothetical protein DFQ29_000665, partial [Apophysomyces sp. BC1021]